GIVRHIAPRTARRRLARCGVPVLMVDGRLASPLFPYTTLFRAAEQVGLRRRYDGDLDRVPGVVAFVAFADLVLVVGEGAKVVGAGGESARLCHRDGLVVVTAGGRECSQRWRGLPGQDKVGRVNG